MRSRRRVGTGAEGSPLDACGRESDSRGIRPLQGRQVPRGRGDSQLYAVADSFAAHDVRGLYVPVLRASWPGRLLTMRSSNQNNNIEQICIACTLPARVVRPFEDLTVYEALCPRCGNITMTPLAVMKLNVEGP